MGVASWFSSGQHLHVHLWLNKLLLFNMLRVRPIILLLVAALAGDVKAQEKPRLGKDGRPLLNRPKLELCKKRQFHEKYGGHHYFLSWREPWHKFEDWDWFNARNFCRERCMDLVSFESPQEYRHFATMMYYDNVSSIHTSGRKCNFQNKGCDAAHLQPININGWFWADGNTRIPPTNQPSKLTFWSRTGEARKRQPDNFQGLKAGRLKVKDPSGLTVEGLQEYYDEACLAVLNNRYKDGVQWHDMPCYFRSKIICEDSELQMSRIKKEMGVDVTIPITRDNF